MSSKFYIFVIFLIHQLLIIFVHNTLYPIHYTPKNLFFLELIGNKLDITYEAPFVLDAGNLFLLWLISKLIFKNNFSSIPPFIYAIIPWSSYLVSAGSFYIYLLFILLIAVYGIFIGGSHKRLGQLLLIGGIVGGVYSSSLLLLILPVILCLLIIFNLISIKYLKSSSAILFLLLSPLLFSVYTNQAGFKNIIENEIKIFSDPGLINTVNSYQGAAKEIGFGTLARISENRYIFSSEYILLKYIRSLTLTTFFTSWEKLLGFSFSPPIYLGFLIPFLTGLYQVIKFPIFRKAFLLSTLLLIPSILSKSWVDLNRMIIFAPIVIFVITYGIITLYENKKNKSNIIAPFFLMLMLFLVIFQLLVTFFDVKFKEGERYMRYYKQDYELGKQ